MAAAVAMFRRVLAAVVAAFFARNRIRATALLVTAAVANRGRLVFFVAALVAVARI